MKILSFLFWFLLCSSILAEEIQTHIFSSISSEEKNVFGLEWTEHEIYFDDWFVQKRAGFDDRGWMAFPIPASIQEISSATLKFSLVGFNEADVLDPTIEVFLHSSEFYGIHQNDWNLSEETSFQRWRDFGEGSYYGGFAVDSEWERDIWGDWIVDADFEIDLSPSAVRDINTSRGRGWAIGAKSEGLGSLRIAGHPLFRRAFLDITYNQPFLPGDYNFDKYVDQADLDLVLLGWGQEYDQDELDSVLLNWGKSQTLLVGSSIPEPSSSVCVVIFVLSCYIWALISLPKGTTINARLSLPRSKAQETNQGW